MKKHLGPLVQGRVERFELDNIEALNFVLHDALDGGATRSLRLDGLGKSLAGAVLYMPVDEEVSGEMDAFETITCAMEGPVATITLNRPEARNALSLAMVEELLRCFTALREEAYRDVRVVVLRAAGETFCAGRRPARHERGLGGRRRHRRAAG